MGKVHQQTCQTGRVIEARGLTVRAGSPIMRLHHEISRKAIEGDAGWRSCGSWRATGGERASDQSLRIVLRQRLLYMSVHMLRSMFLIINCCIDICNIKNSL